MRESRGGQRRGGATLALIGSVLMVLLVAGGGPARARTAGQPRYFAPTHLTMAGEFTPYFDTFGGLPVFGYPITDAHMEGGYLVQYFERERLEYHPENQDTPYEVLLGRLGAEMTVGREIEPAFQRLPGPPAPLPPDRRWVPETGHTLGGRFAAYWDSHGGLAIFGYPISEEFDDKGTVIQWFERARFEYHPENAPPYDILLGLLGREALDVGDPNVFDVDLAVSSGPPHDRRLVLGLAQGGESFDPDFLQNVIPLGQALHVPYIRIDNIFNYYDVAERLPNGELAFHFDKLDRVIDQVRALGAEPFLCLDYVPAALAGDHTGIDPPASYDEWRAMVQATARHLNVERRLGIRYWEVWNEPNLINSWTGSYPDYLRLYDVSRDGVLAADPTAHIGGPAVTPLDPTALDWLLGWQETQGAAGRADFLSWHSFGRTTAQITADIAAARAAIAKHPTFHPETIISEFSVPTGGPYDTSQGGRSDTSSGGAYALASLAAMERAGLDKAFLFELKDGENPDASYWGRWGLVTHDGKRKPAYQAILAYQQMRTGQLPVQATRGGDLGVDLLAAQGPDGSTRLLLWHNGVVPLRARISLPPALAARTYRVTVFDTRHNNFAKQGDDHVVSSLPRPGDRLIFDLEADSFVILESP